MEMYLATFYAISAFCAILFYYSRGNTAAVSDENFQKLQRNYLAVYLLAMASDWLQGPHVYALYQSYGMTTNQIQLLFVVGFGSSMLIGTVVGSFADRFGRRNNCTLYGVLYGMSCLTKHFPNFWVLLIGRFLGGTATSILCSAFESWLVCEYNEKGCNPDHLGVVFSNATLGNSLVAIVAGFVAQFFANLYGFVAPFDASFVVLFLMIIVILWRWEENYGNSSASVISMLHEAWLAIKSDSKVFYLGVIQSLFEGAMYTFVLEWTPALTPSRQQGDVVVVKTIPHGVIFSSFMVAVMIGSSLFKVLTKVSKPQSFMRFVFLISALALITPVISSQSHTLIYVAFVVFEVCVGIFWPAMGTMRGEYVPEKSRATVMNCFRLPLNLLVIFILIQSWSRSTIFLCCVVLLLAATFFQELLWRTSRKVDAASLTIA